MSITDSLDGLPEINQLRKIMTSQNCLIVSERVLVHMCEDKMIDCYSEQIKSTKSLA